MSAHAYEESDLDPLFELLDPDPNSKVMGKKFTDTIGYNPITYYTQKAGEDVFGDVYDKLENYPKTMAKLKECSENIINDLVENTENTRAQYAYFGIKRKIREIMESMNEVPQYEIREIMDSLERKYNLNYRERSFSNNSLNIKNSNNNDSEKESSDEKSNNNKKHPLPDVTIQDDDDILEFENSEDIDINIDDDDEDDHIVGWDDDDEDDGIYHSYSDEYE